jgi:hypothetical protein
MVKVRPSLPAAGTTHWILDVSDPIDLSALEPLPDDHPALQPQAPPAAAAPGPAAAPAAAGPGRAPSPRDDGSESRRDWPNGASAEQSGDWSDESGTESDGSGAGERSDYGDPSPKHRQVPERTVGPSGGANGQGPRAGEGRGLREQSKDSRSMSEHAGSRSLSPSRSPVSEGRSSRRSASYESEGEEVRSNADPVRGRVLAKEQGSNVVGDLVYSNAGKGEGMEETTKPVPDAILKAPEKAPEKARVPPTTKESDSGGSSDGLVVHLNSRENNLAEFKKLKSKVSLAEQNSVTTSKYTVYNFLVLNLSQQFSRLANCYFLIIASLQLLTPLSPTGRFSTAAPLALVSHHHSSTMFASSIAKEMKIDQIIPVK